MLYAWGEPAQRCLGRPGAGKPTGLSCLIRAAGKPGSLDEVAGVRNPARSNKKRHTVKVCLFLLNEADGARTRDLSRDRAAL